MTVQELNSKWESISAPKGGGLYSRKIISSQCKSNLMIGISKNGNRCVMLMLNSKLDSDFHAEDKENLKLYYNNSKPDNDLVLELKDTFFENLFAELVISLFEALKEIDNEDQGKIIFINTVRYWSEFLKSKRSMLLSDEIIEGLYGELVYLEYILKNSTDPINTLLNSWKGPYNTNHDFHFFDKNVEVKTKQKTGNLINISSEYQLQSENDKELELAVVSLVTVSKSGDTLKQILDRIREKIINHGGLISILSDALAEKMLNFKNVEEYNSLQFIVSTIQVFDCDHSGFPKIVRDKLNDSIQGVSYRLALNSIDDNFLLKTIDLQ
jgi:hypothetical protein